MSTDDRDMKIALDADTRERLGDLAAACKRAPEEVAAELVREAMDLCEDQALSRLADETLAKTTEWIGHDQAWKEDMPAKLRRGGAGRVDAGAEG